MILITLTYSCLPWDMAHDDENRTTSELCDAAGNDCFWSRMRDFSHMGNECHCLADCDAVKFSFSEKQLPIDLKSECVGSNPGFGQTIRKITFTLPFFAIAYDVLTNTKPNQTIDWKQQVRVSANNNIYQAQCLKMYAEDISLVEVQMEEQTFLKLRQSLRITLPEKLGNIGGNLGLMCGFSALAIFELIHWSFKFVTYGLSGQY